MRHKKSKTTKILFGEPCKKVEFPLIQPAAGNRSSFHGVEKAKKNRRVTFKTELDEAFDPFFSIVSEDAGRYGR